MPANLTPEYKEAEARYRDATTPDEKEACLREMLRVIPKHKGTEKLQADLKRRLAKIRGGGRKRVTRKHPGEFVEKEGAKQVVLVGGPNSGKSALMAALTSARPEIAPYPFTTTRLAPGMMPFEDIQIQLVDSPAISREFAKPWMSNQLRACDLVLWVVSLGNDDVLTAVDETRSVLADWRIRLRPVDAVGGASEEGERERGVTLPALLVGTHADVEAADVRAELLLESVGDGWSLLRTAATTGEGLDPLRRQVFDALGIVRVYTKQPGKRPDMGIPYVLDQNCTILDLAEKIHKDLAGRFRFARIWGKDAFDGQHVQRDHVLADGDVVELHA